MSFPGFPGPPPPPGSGVPPAPSTHNLLGVSHDDTVPAFPVDGDIITATGSLWSRLPIGGDGYLLVATSGLPIWTPPGSISGISSSGTGGGGAAPGTTVITSGAVFNAGNDQLIAVASGTTTVALTASPEDAQLYRIKDANGVAATQNITIDGSGNTIDGNSTISLTINYQSVTLQYNSLEWNVV